MAKNKVVANGGPKTPQPKRLEELIDWVTELKTSSPPATPEEEQHNENCQEVAEALDWTHTMLSNRKFYMKRQQLKKKISLQLAKEALSKADLDHIEKQAKEMAEQLIGEEGE